MLLCVKHWLAPYLLGKTVSNSFAQLSPVGRCIIKLEVYPPLFSHRSLAQECQKMVFNNLIVGFLLPYKHRLCFESPSRSILWRLLRWYQFDKPGANRLIPPAWSWQGTRCQWSHPTSMILTGVCSSVKINHILVVILVLAWAKRWNLPRYDEACDFLREVKPLLDNVNRIKQIS